jgi:HPt (histidine-containing phosphotransfer) domain-containing protein
MVNNWSPKFTHSVSSPAISAGTGSHSTNELDVTAASADEIEISAIHFDQIYNDLGRENIANFANIFFQDLKKISTNMISAAQHNDWKNVKLNAHSLKSSTLSFGLIRLSQLADEIEMQCKDHGKAEARLMQAWPMRMEVALTSLNEHFEKLNLPPVG